MINNKQELIEILKNDWFEMFVAEDILHRKSSIIIVFENLVSFYMPETRNVLVGMNIIKLTRKEELLYLSKYTLDPTVFLFSDFNNVLRYEDEVQLLLTAKIRKDKLKKLLHS